MLSSLLHVLLLSLLFHPCESRHLSTKHSRKLPHHHSSKDLAMVNFGETSDPVLKPTPYSSERVQVKGVFADERPKDHLETPPRDDADGMRGVWPREEYGKNPEFSVDYEAPRTHPPSHN